MKNEITLSNGVRIEFTENGVNVISSDDELIQFDGDGKLLRKAVFNKEENFIKYFDFMGSEEQKIAREWAETIEGETDKQNKFIELAKEAGGKIKDDYYIANIESSIDCFGELYYKKGHMIAHRFPCDEWKQKALEFAPELESDLATHYQLVLWYAYRIAKGCWTISYVCDDSSIAGNYWNSPNAAHKFEVSGAREVGGAKDGVGNTYKIVTDGEAGFVLFGGYCCDDGDVCTVGTAKFIFDPACASSCGSGVLVLNKVHNTDH